ncbi:MAG: TonB-dependent receptor [Polyangiaceae bacterium]|nr:TonB-dependent receptor [Polyangiaceae bacterium]
MTTRAAGAVCLAIAVHAAPARGQEGSADAEPIEVEVVGERPAPSATTWTHDEVRAVPGAFGDAFRALELSPGVTPIASGVPYFFLRGAPPANIGYDLDGVRIPLLFHVGFGPSVVHPALVDRVDLHAGAYPARLGRYAGGMVEARLVEPSGLLRAETQIRLFDTGAFVEAPFDGGRGAALAAYRYSYAGAVLSLASPDVDLSYADYQARLGYSFSDQDRVTLFAFGSHDVLEQTSAAGDLDTVLDSDFHRVDLRWDRALEGGGSARTAVTWGFDRSSSSGGELRAEAQLGRVRADQVHRLGPGVILTAGADALLESFALSVHDGGTEGDEALARLLSSRVDVTAGAYADLAISVGPALELVPGLRVDLFASGAVAAVGVDPRLSSRVTVTDKLRFAQTVGVVSQRPSYLGAIPGVAPAGLEGGLQRGLLTSASVEVELPREVTTEVTFFRNAFFDMTDALGSRVGEREESFEDAAGRRATGDAHGLELSVRRSLSKQIGGLVSYTLSRSTRSASGETFAHAFDRRHVAQAALSFKLGRGWTFGQRIVVLSGTPLALEFDRSWVHELPEGLTAEERAAEQLRRVREQVELERAARALDLPDRLPPFLRVDLRLEKRWWLPPYSLAFVAEAQNTMGARETLSYECAVSEGCGPVHFGPIVIPSVGLEASL